VISTAGFSGYNFDPCTRSGHQTSGSQGRLSRYATDISPWPPYATRRIGTGPDLGMVDHVTPSKRSEIMRAVRSRDTGPELSLRTMLHRAGYRYRLHVKELPGTPDIVLPRLRAVIFVHGCYWHGHAGCSKAALPKSRVEFWRAKVMANRSRDRARISELKQAGWAPIVVWQCELRDPARVLRRVTDFLQQAEA
jgi:DNA mismatch endonuclease, patch repair protein